jgi:hypothetical protein
VYKGKTVGLPVSVSYHPKHKTQTRRDETVEHSLPTELRSLNRGKAVSACRSADVSMTSGELLTERGGVSLGDKGECIGIRVYSKGRGGPMTYDTDTGFPSVRA